uniref:Sugar phosphate phosphatase n=1 Tax=Sinocyclocheilus grahami TaxID=75366 RepID=A0A672KGW2_SINGR
ISRSFAYLTLRDRLPTILTKVIDTLHRNKDNFFKEYGEEGIQADKRAISFLSKLRNELQTDKPVQALTDNAEDTEAWNECMRRQQDLLKTGGLSAGSSHHGSMWSVTCTGGYRRLCI